MFSAKKVSENNIQKSMPKTSKGKSLHSYKLYNRRIAEDADVKLSKASFAVLNTLASLAVANLVEGASQAKSSSKMLSVSDLRTFLQISNTSDALVALQFATTAVEKSKSGKPENEVKAKE